MHLAIATFAIVLSSAATLAIAQGLKSGEQVTTEFLEVQGPPTSGWQLSGKSPGRIALARPGSHLNETFAAFAIVYRLEQPRDRDHFLELIRKGVVADTFPTRFRQLQAEFQHDQSRGYLCIRYTAVHEDLQARLISGATGTLTTQTHSLYCLLPQEQGAGFAAGYSHRGENLHAEFHTEAIQFITSAQVRAR